MCIIGCRSIARIEHEAARGYFKVFPIHTCFSIFLFILHMNSDNNGSAIHQTLFRSSINKQGNSNPFTKIIHNSRARSPGHGESSFSRERQASENIFQTPQQRIRPFQTPNNDKTSTLAPYINLLRGYSANATSVQQSQLRLHEVRQPSLFLYA